MCIRISSEKQSRAVGAALGLAVLADCLYLGIVLPFKMLLMKKTIFTIESESLGCYAQSHDLEVGILRGNTASSYVSEFVYAIVGEILADSEDSDEICREIAHKRTDSSQRWRCR